jgi:hypothetical protein
VASNADGVHGVQRMLAQVLALDTSAISIHQHAVPLKHAKASMWHCLHVVVTAHNIQVITSCLQLAATMDLGHGINHTCDCPHQA